MPTHVYRCAKCGAQIEAFQSFAYSPLTTHADCGGKLTKVLSAAGIVPEGSGFYKTDVRAGSAKGTSREQTKESASSSSDSSSSDSKSSDSGPLKASSDSSSGSSSGSEAKSA